MKASDGLKLSSEFIKGQRAKAKKRVDRQEDQRDIFDKYSELMAHNPDGKKVGSGSMNIADSQMFLKSFVVK